MNYVPMRTADQILYIRELHNKIEKLEQENKRLSERLSEAGWKESSYRASMVSKYGGEDW